MTRELKPDEMEFIRKMKRSMVATHDEKNRLWELYLVVNERYPNGEKGCGRCVTEVINELFAFVEGLPKPSVEEEFKDIPFKPKSHPKPAKKLEKK